MYLIDTNVVSEARKRDRADAGVRAFVSGLAEEDVGASLSVVTIGELWRGVANVRGRGEHDHADRLERWFDEVLTAFADNILPVDVDVARMWGRLRAKDAGNPVDKLIAATALVYGLTVVTRDERGFAGTGVAVLNPFESAR
jgi:toxin FitB